MTWFKVDDRFHSHPKVLALRSGPHEETAITLWVKAGSWCASNLTNGEVPEYVLETLVRRNADKAAAELVRVGLWETTAEGFRFRSWTEYQPTKEAVESRRKKNADKVASWRDRNRGGDQGCNQVTREVVTTSVTLPPTRPDPSQENIDTSGSAEPNPVTVLKPKAPKDDPEAARVFAAWLEEHVAEAHRSQAKFNAARRKVIAARMREGYGADRLIAAIRGVKFSRWHMGENQDGRRYTGLETILRDGAQVEKFEALAALPKQVAANSNGQPRGRMLF